MQWVTATDQKPCEEWKHKTYIGQLMEGTHKKCAQSKEISGITHTQKKKYGSFGLALSCQWNEMAIRNILLYIIL